MLALLSALTLNFAPPSIRVIDDMLRDPLIKWGAIEQLEERITVVDIDELSLAKLGAWPWQRGQIADLIEVLISSLGARAVALDMVLPEIGDEAGSARLVALAEHAPLTLSVALDYMARHPALAVGEPGRGQPLNSDQPMQDATGYIGNHSLFRNARCVGNIGFLPDPDGSIRRLPFFSRLGNQVYLPLAAALVHCAGHEILTSSLQLLPEGSWRIPYQRDWRSFTVVSAHAVLTNKAPSELFSGRMVLIGSSALGLSDRVTTPLSASTSGVLVHASSLSALLDSIPTVPYSIRLGMMIVWMTISLIAWHLLISKLNPASSVLFLAAMALLWLGFAAWYPQALLPLLPMLVFFTVLMLVGVPFEWWSSRQESARVLRIFSHYVAPSVLEALLRQPEEKRLEPKFRAITVLIADMENYTSLTTQLPLHETARLTRSFLDILTRPVLSLSGTLDKYTGDGLVAFWGAPIECPDQVDRAIDAALEIVSSVAEMNIHRISDGAPPIRVRIGIESGTALVGDLGTPFRSTYTAVGDCINFASRLQDAARDLPCDIIVGPHAYSQVTRHSLRHVRDIHIRGTSQVIPVYSESGK